MLKIVSCIVRLNCVTFVNINLINGHKSNIGSATITWVI